MDLNEITRLVAEGQTEEALDALKKDAQIFQQEIILLNTRYENLEKRVIQGTISEEVRMLETNRINAAILELIQNYKKKREALTVEDKLPKEKQGAPKNRSAGRSRLQLSTLLKPMGFLLLIAALLIIFFMIRYYYKEEPPVQEKGKQKETTEQKVDVKKSSDEATLEQATEEKTAQKELPTVAFEPTQKFYIGTVSSEEGGKFSYQVLNGAYGDNQLKIAVTIKNRFEIPVEISAFKLSDYKSNGRENPQFYQRLAKNNTPTILQAQEEFTYNPVFDYKLGSNRNFIIYIDYKIPSKGINSRAGQKFTMPD